MDSIQIKERMSILSKQMQEYATTLFELEDTQKKIDELTVEFLAAIEDEKNNPWVETPDVLFIKSDHSPRLMIYPYVRDGFYSHNRNRKEYSTVGKKFVGLSSRTSCPYKYLSGLKYKKKTGHWCSSFRVRERQLEEYRRDCLLYLSEQLGSSDDPSF